jgi:hypothetical protein
MYKHPGKPWRQMTAGEKLADAFQGLGTIIMALITIAVIFAMATH